MFIKYKATKENVVLLERAMKELGYQVEKVKAEKDYKEFKSSNWHMMFHNNVNLKMQEIEKAAQ